MQPGTPRRCQFSRLSGRRNRLRGRALAAHAETTIHYLIRKEQGVAKAKRTLERILHVFGVAPVEATVIHNALGLPVADFEDSVTAAAAQLSNCDLIVTRDPHGFRGSPVRALTPAASVPILVR